MCGGLNAKKTKSKKDEKTTLGIYEGINAFGMNEGFGDCWCFSVVFDGFWMFFGGFSGC